MTIPAGQLLLVGGYDVSRDTTNYGHTMDSPAQVVTGLFHDKVQRDQVAAEDLTFELSGFFRPGVTSGLFSRPGDRDRVSRVYGKVAGSRAQAFGGAILPMRSFETPVGQRVAWKGNGEVDGEGIADAFVLYRHPEGTLSTLAAGNQTFYTGAARSMPTSERAQRTGRSASWLTSQDTWTLQMQGSRYSTRLRRVAPTPTSAEVQTSDRLQSARRIRRSHIYGRRAQVRRGAPQPCDVRRVEDGHGRCSSNRSGCTRLLARQPDRQPTARRHDIPRVARRRNRCHRCTARHLCRKHEFPGDPAAIA